MKRVVLVAVLVLGVGAPGVEAATVTAKVKPPPGREGQAANAAATVGFGASFNNPQAEGVTVYIRRCKRTKVVRWHCHFLLTGRYVETQQRFRCSAPARIYRRDFEFEPPPATTCPASWVGYQ